MISWWLLISREQREALDDWLAWVRAKDDVYFVTGTQTLLWMTDPTPVTKLANFEPWQCENKPVRCWSQRLTRRSNLGSIRPSKREWENREWEIKESLKIRLKSWLRLRIWAPVTPGWSQKSENKKLKLNFRSHQSRASRRTSARWLTRRAMWTWWGENWYLKTFIFKNICIFPKKGTWPPARPVLTCTPGWETPRGRTLRRGTSMRSSPARTTSEGGKWKLWINCKIQSEHK